MKPSVACAVIAAICFGRAAPAADARPNIVLIIGDDHAWTDYGFMDNAQVRTPHIDRLAAESLTYTRGYVTTALCSPSLATLLTGLHPHQHGITGNDPVKGQPREAWLERFFCHPLLPKLLADAGYVTMHTGKYWMREPADAGFTRDMGETDRHGGKALAIGRESMQPIYDAIDAAGRESKPFFIWYAPFLPHTPHNPPQRLLDKYAAIEPPARAKYYAMIEWLDETVGDLMANLKSRGIDENTLVVYLNDNGWNDFGKLTPYENGVRTPVALRWPGKVAARVDREHLASNIDIVPTLLTAAGVPLPAGLPGVNLLDAKAVAARDTIFLSQFTHDMVAADSPGQSLLSRTCIEGGWKLIDWQQAPPGNGKPQGKARKNPGARQELFDLAADPAETRNLAAEQPERLQALAARLDDWWKPAVASGEPTPRSAEADGWRQAPEPMPVAKAGAAAAPTTGVTAATSRKPAAWIWGPDADREYRLAKTFSGGAATAILVASCDNRMRLFVNGAEVGSSASWERPVVIDVTKHVRDGDNELAAVVANAGGPAGFSCRLVLADVRGRERVIESDGSWTAFDTASSDSAASGRASSERAAPAAPVALRVVAGPGQGPWGDVLAKDVAPPTIPAFAVPAGFRVERLFVVPQEELGSWVSLTTDPKGRLIASDQGDKGLVRITPAALDGSGETRVEKIPVAVSGAQGLLWAFDALYAVCNGGPGSGLYRITDANGDDTLDTVEKLRDLDGGGEHGPHNIILSPDGTRLFVICGNSTKVPFEVRDVTEPQTMGGIRATQRRVELSADGTSRLPANWDEDQIITRMWDANGHAAGKLAPGGFVASTDRDGTAWEIWTAGYRNPYDMAFNADGELFVYDADMEWDFGTPWYRPTRVNHAASGSDLGWRSGSGKWQPSFPDSLPALVEIGPGSPVGASFGYGTTFPAKYQRALYICDWTFGTMYAIHLEPAGSTYRGVKEEFVSRTPLPLTDVTVGRDGAMYFTVGGRGGQSELYRVTYAGSEPTAPADARDTAGSAERRLRRDFEALHRRADDPAAAVARALPHLAHPDRFIRHAARVALEHQPIDLWQERALAGRDPRGIITGAIAVAHQAEQSAGPAVLAALDRIDPGSLDVAGRIDLVRAYELALVRLGAPSAEAAARIAARLGPLFPSGDVSLDRELASVLVGVRAPGIVAKLVGLLAAPTSAAGSTNLAPSEDDLRRLLDRNAGYGRAVKASLDNRSDLLQIHYAYVLRTVGEKEAWTAADRRGYYEWFARAREWAGGNSFRKFLTNIENESLAHLTDAEKLALETTGIRKPWVPPPLPRPEGPGRAWSVDDVLALAARPGAEGLATGRDFGHGKRSFAAARCVVCHRFGEDGGSTGPDLTQAAGRFQLKDMVEAIVHPSKVVSDQYKGSIVQTADGRVVSGRVVNESADRITVVTDPEDATKFVELARSDIEEILPATESLMPKGLLDQLNEREVLDLVAYVLSKDKSNASFFKTKNKKK